jgi:hypothetical protein
MIVGSPFRINSPFSIQPRRGANAPETGEEPPEPNLAKLEIVRKFGRNFGGVLTITGPPEVADARLQQIICVGAEIQAVDVAVGIDQDVTVQGIERRLGRMARRRAIDCVVERDHAGPFGQRTGGTAEPWAI